MEYKVILSIVFDYSFPSDIFFSICSDQSGVEDVGLVALN
jgi:hypothetical protein